MRNGCEKDECSHTFAHAPNIGRTDVCGAGFYLRIQLNSLTQEASTSVVCQAHPSPHV